MQTKNIGFTDKLQGGYMSAEGSNTFSYITNQPTWISAFQTYINRILPDAELMIDSKWTKETQEYANKYGEEYRKIIAKMPNSISTLNNLAPKYFPNLYIPYKAPTPPSSKGAVASKGLSVQVDESGIVIEETKPKMSGKKIGIIIAVVAAVGVIGFVLYKRSKK